MNKNDEKEDVSSRRYAFEAREKTVVDFDEKNKAQLEITLAELQKILNIKLLVVLRGCEFDMDNQARYDAYALTKSALDVLVSALHMARQRAAVETFALLRVALECGSTALHISQDAEEYKRYKRKDYDSTRAIKFAKKHIPILGELWGACSQFAVHTNVIGFGPRLDTNDKGEIIRSVILEYGNREPEPVQDKVCLTSVSLFSAIILKTAELILFEKHPLYDGTLRLVGTETIYISNTDARIVRFEEELRSYPSQAR